MLPNAAFWANCRNSSKCAFLHWLTPRKKPSDVTKCSILGKLQEFLKVCLPAPTHTNKEALRRYQMQHFGQFAGIPQSVPSYTASHLEGSPQTLPNAAFWAMVRHSPYMTMHQQSSNPARNWCLSEYGNPSGSVEGVILWSNDVLTIPQLSFNTHLHLVASGLWELLEYAPKPAMHMRMYTPVCVCVCICVWVCLCKIVRVWVWV